MEQFKITGGRPLHGSVSVAGAKNAALPLLCASILTSETVNYDNVPHLRDIQTLKRLLISLGGVFSERPTDATEDEASTKEHMHGQSINLTFANITNAHAPYEAVKTMRASVLVLAPLLARHKFARVALPGGCAIGARPIDIHLKGLEAMGAEINIEHGDVIAKCPQLKGAEINMRTVTVTGTENLLMAAVLAEGETILNNAACEPEVIDLAMLLTSMGANIQGAGTSQIIVQGVSGLHTASHRVIADRIETGTLLCAVVACGGDVTLHSTQANYLESVIEKLRQMGAIIATTSNSIRIIMSARAKAVDVTTAPYPGFPTDMQAQLMAVNALATGTALISENIFENRFMHVTELARMGAKISIDDHCAFVEGTETLQGAPVMATDLRASAGLVIAGLAARGVTTISRIYHLDRGYAQLEKKLTQLGANVKREKEPD